MAEYIFTDLPRYIRVTSRTEFSSSVVHSGSVLLFSEDGSSLTAKLPDGSFITVGGSGGTDVSSTTAEAADVLSGKVFYNSGGTQTSGTIPTVSASITSGAVVVPAGYIANSQSFPVSSGTDVILGYVSGGLFYELAFSGTSSIEVASSAGLLNVKYNLPGESSGGQIISGASVTSNTTISSGMVAIDTEIGSRGELYVLSGATVINTAITGSGFLEISGGIAQGVELLHSVGRIGIYSGGYMQHGILSGGQLHIESHSLASDVSVNNSGFMYVSSGGTATSVTVNSGGHLIVSSGGTALAVDSKTGAYITAYGYIEYVTSN